LKLVKEAIKRAGLDPKNYAPGTILSFISLAKSQSLTPEEFSQTCSSYFDEVVSKSYSIYQEMLSQNNALDFDDLLMKTVRLLGNNKKVLEKYQHRYSYILVDEFQDTNLVQYQLIKLLAAKHRNVCVVGDPDQSIYSWRSADIRNILNFEKDYPDAKTILLEQNYRSTSYILEAASSLISVNQARKPKELWTENEPGDKIRLIETYDQQEEARILTREISKLVESSQYSLGDMAVLFRTNAQSRAIEEALVRYGIPYKLAAGTRFYERREIKDILGYFKLIYNIADSMSLFRIINTPTRGIGKQTVEELNRLALHNKTSEGETIISLLNEYDGEIEQFVSPRSLKILKAFSLFLNDLRDNSRHLRTLDLYDNIIERIHYKDYILAQPDGEDRWQNVLELRNVAQQYNDLSPQEGLSAMLESISLVSDLDGLNDFQRSLSLITLHQAKGLEFPVVFIVGLEEGLLPHYRSIDDPAQLEEERRLFYVGITRAKKLLYLLRAYKRMLMGTSQINSVSRFVKDIPSQLIEGHEDKQQDMKSLWRPVQA
jgi:DNA helicase-2/ATP-dependent DNA helicase PcrA